MSEATRSGRWKSGVGTVVFGLVVLGAFASLMLYAGRPAELPEALRTGGTLGAAVAAEAEDGVPVVAFATAEWCGPCQALKRGALSDERVQAYLTRNARFVKLEDTVPEEAAEIGQLGVMGFPTLAVIRGGKVQARLTGEVPAEALLAWLREQVPEREGDGAVDEATGLGAAAASGDA